MKLLQKAKALFVVPEQKPKTYEILIRGHSLQNGLSMEVVAAVILQESDGNPYAFRYEPAFYERYLANKLPASLGGTFHKGISFESEVRFRAFSFGLMQIMGQVARENKFTGYLPELFLPEINIPLGCKILGQNLRTFKGDYRKAISAYNSGVGFVRNNGSTAYADKVLARIESNEICRLLTI